jgi:hypothetical protein
MMTDMDTTTTFIHDAFFCSITRKIMMDPVLSASTGISYERQAIEEQSRNSISPPLLIPNLALRKTIREAVYLEAAKMQKEQEQKMEAVAALLALSSLEEKEETIEIQVQMLTGAIKTIRCKTGASILDIKKKMIEIPIMMQRLIYNGRQLADDTTLTDHGIIHGTKIYLVFRMRSHSFSTCPWDNIPHHLAENVHRILQRHCDEDQPIIQCAGGAGGGGGL